MVPAGIGPSFAGIPGQVAPDAHAAGVAASKWEDAPPALTAADQAASIDFMRRTFTGKIAPTLLGARLSG